MSVDLEWFRKWIDKFQIRLEERARDAKPKPLNLAGVNLSEIDNPGRILTPEGLRQCLYKNERVFSYERMICIGAPGHLEKLSDVDLSQYIYLATERHEDARGLSYKQVRFQAHHMHVIRNAYAELLKRTK